MPEVAKKNFLLFYVTTGYAFHDSRYRFIRSLFHNFPHVIFHFPPLSFRPLSRNPWFSGTNIFFLHFCPVIPAQAGI